MERFRNIALLVLVLWLGFASMPAPPGPGGVGLDASWILGLRMADEQGLVFGRDLGFTYGPLGYLTASVMPADHPAWDNFAFVSALYALHWFCLWRLRASPAIAAFTAVLCFALSPYVWDQFELGMVLLAATIVYLRAREPGRSETFAVCLLAALAGLAWLARLHQGIGATALLGTVLLYRSPKRHRALAPAISAAIFLALWILKKQPLDAIPAYFSACFHIVTGYNEAMALAGPAWPVLTAAAAVAGVAALTIWASDLAVLPAAVLFCGLAFKHGLVREGGHTSPMHLKIAAAALLAGMAVREARNAKWFLALAGANLALGVYMTATFSPFLIDNLRHRFTGYYPRAWVTAYSDYETYAKQMASARIPTLAPRLLDPASREKIGDAAVDVSPHNIDVVAANRLRWSPRPVFQSYSAYTPYLDAWNAKHYSDESRPRRILLHWETFDGRHPWFDDPLTWREVLGRYAVDAPTNQGLLLKPEGRGLAESPMGPATETGWNEWMAVPEGTPEGWVAAKLRVEPNWLGRASTLLLRGVPVMMDLEFHGGGEAMTVRTVRANLVSGPIVSVLPGSLEEEARGWKGTGGSGLRRVKRIRLWTAAEGRYESRIGVQWVSLTKQ